MDPHLHLPLFLESRAQGQSDTDQAVQGAQLAPILHGREPGARIGVWSTVQDQLAVPAGGQGGGIEGLGLVLAEVKGETPGTLVVQVESEWEMDVCLMSALCQFG